jgi:hypothetical protein
VKISLFNFNFNFNFILKYRTAYVAGATMGAAAVVVGIPVGLVAVGFGAAGPVAGTIAAGIQSTIGGTWLFATCQSVAMAGLSAAGTALSAVVGGEWEWSHREWSLVSNIVVVVVVGQEKVFFSNEVMKRFCELWKFIQAIASERKIYYIHLEGAEQVTDGCVSWLREYLPVLEEFYLVTLKFEVCFFIFLYIFLFL